MTSRVPSSHPDAVGGSQDPAVDALLQLREARSESARTRLQAKQVEIATLEREIDKIQTRKAKITDDRGGEVLQARLLLDRLTRVLLDRQRELRK